MDQKIVDDVTKLQAAIAEAKRKKNKLEGSMEEQYKIYTKQFGIKDIEQGKEKVKKLIQEKKKLGIKIEELYETMQEKYNW